MGVERGKTKMSLTYTNALTTLNTILGDSNDTTFTTSEKGRALTKAWNDSFVVNKVWDTSLTYTTGTYQKTLPATLTTLHDIYLSATGASSPFPEPIDNSLWELVNGVIQFSPKANSIIPHNSVLYLKGNYKLTISDSIANTNMQEYVLAIAGADTLKLLAHKKANLFTKNKVSMSELIGLKRELENDVVKLRRMLPTSWESA
jgi:hypothetical protein